jgi:hypothetical protein
MPRLSGGIRRARDWHWHLVLDGDLLAAAGVVSVPGFDGIFGCQAHQMPKLNHGWINTDFQEESRGARENVEFQGEALHFHVRDFAKATLIAPERFGNLAITVRLFEPCG